MSLESSVSTMQFCSTKFEDAWLLKIEPHNDKRGFFARTWCSDELRQQGLCDRLVQCSVSFNQHKGTLRGMHFQAKPCEEVKIVRCTRGAIFDVLVDCRVNSPTFGQWEGFVLDEENRDALYIPAGFAHGFQTQTECTEVLYQMNEYHQPDFARGFHHLDSRIGIQWPGNITMVSAKDSELVTFDSCMVSSKTEHQET
ncbi:dTDP-4-dehydrorhamnose 3,5-epimerase [Rhodopirellula europaea]|uniref:dTDP-4-dehydrorhamnose 3,5-epimerase n=1 Tax=Rhodopirellula europaea TaxID=1263866 RepID=UPI003D28241E